jgi:heme exporter protein CcmD
MSGGLGNWLAMGGHAQFIWPAYFLTAAALVGLLVHSLRALRARESELAKTEGRQSRPERDPE